MIETNYAVTQAIRVLKEKEVPFVIHSYKYEEHGGTPVAARELGVDEHAVIKTLVFETDAREPLIVLMHGDREVSTKNPRLRTPPINIRVIWSAASPRSGRASA